eukprot:gnl/TRDRNA2_/TRDRNA2_206171_c0_seq1.p1 gnl/TRDRNA2_/TRDRNA2_206171_c0~~gnl/TRDRNA2_/TRDRNA2_206171_c0_seq1.p1  ORF type:complete len:388 (+),score=34.92 gnl/TRDRNA2_/TRDRNA2_206171_c0_seq1:126-1166(+)
MQAPASRATDLPSLEAETEGLHSLCEHLAQELGKMHMAYAQSVAEAQEFSCKTNVALAKLTETQTAVTRLSMENAQLRAGIDRTSRAFREDSPRLLWSTDTLAPDGMHNGETEVLSLERRTERYLDASLDARLGGNRRERMRFPEEASPDGIGRGVIGSKVGDRAGILGVDRWQPMGADAPSPGTGGVGAAMAQRPAWNANHHAVAGRRDASAPSSPPSGRRPVGGGVKGPTAKASPQPKQADGQPRTPPPNGHGVARGPNPSTGRSPAGLGAAAGSPGRSGEERVGPPAYIEAVRQWERCRLRAQGAIRGNRATESTGGGASKSGGTTARASGTPPYYYYYGQQS